MANNHRFTWEWYDSHDTVQMELQEWTLNTSGEISLEQLVQRSQGTEKTQKGKRKHSLTVNGLFSEHFDVKTNKRSMET